MYSFGPFENLHVVHDGKEIRHALKACKLYKILRYTVSY